MRRQDPAIEILKILREEEMYGYAIRERLPSNGVRIELTNLYKLLTAMEKKGLIKGEWRISESGPKRRVYRLCDNGREELNRKLIEAARTIGEFYYDHLTSLLATNPIKKVNALVDRYCHEENTALVLPERLCMTYEWLIKDVCAKVKDNRVYLFKPPQLNIQMTNEPENLSTLSYIHNRIPLKDNFLDCVRAVGVPFAELEEMLKEFNRILKREGCLLLLMPYLKREELLSIGEFIEKIEHGSENGGREMSEEEIMAALDKYFGKVEVSQIAHLTVFTAASPFDFSKQSY